MSAPEEQPPPVDREAERAAARARIDQQQTWVDIQIRRAMERGDFDNLPGKGKPLNLPEVHDPDWWLKSYVRREGIDTSALVHPTIALRREADTFPEALGSPA